MKWFILFTLIAITKQQCQFSEEKFVCEKTTLENAVYEFYTKVETISSVTTVETLNSNSSKIYSFFHPAQYVIAPFLKVIKIINSNVVNVQAEAFSAYTKLKELSLRKNKIVDISFLKSLPTSIENLDLSENNIIQVGFVFSKLTNLKQVDLNFNKLVIFNYDIFEGMNLKFLNISHNNLNKTTKTVNGVLTKCVDFSYNPISSWNSMPSYRCFYASDTFKYLSLGILYQDINEKLLLDIIYIKENDYFNIIAKNNKSVSVPVHINYLDISSPKKNYLTGLNKLNLNIVKELNIRNTTIPVLANSIFSFKKLFQENNSETKLDLSLCSIKDIHSFYFSGYKLGGLNLSNNNIKIIKDHTFDNSTFKELDISNSNIEVIQYSAFYNFSCDTINLSKNKLSVFFVRINCKKINLSSNKISAFRASGSENIEYLDLSDNLLTSIGEPCALCRFKKIETLLLHNNNLVNIDCLFSTSLNINSLTISFNEDLSRDTFKNSDNVLSSLTIIGFNAKKIERNYFAGLFNLKELHFENSVEPYIEPGSLNGLFNIKYLPTRYIFKLTSSLKNSTFKDLRSMSKLDLSSLSIENIENESFVGLRNLELLNLTGNKIRELTDNTFAGLHNLLSLYLSHNKLSIISIGTFKHFKFLEDLDLSYNYLVNLETGLFSSLVYLRTLNLSFNSIGIINSNILFPLKKLSHLYLDGNNFITFDYKNMLIDLKHLNFVGLSSNKWNCDFLYYLLSSFREKDISFCSSANFVYDVKNINGVFCTDLCDSEKYCTAYIMPW